MCGIYLALSATHHVPPAERTRDLLRRRGPDSCRELNQKASNLFLTCFSTVLALRGDQTVVQPVQNARHPNAFLCWNGEAWDLNGSPLSGNDSEQVFSVLSDAVNSSSETIPSKHIIQQTLATIAGPYAFAYFDPCSNTLFFGRDPLGRRSLMFRFDQDRNFILSTISDATEEGWQEVESDGIYSIHLPSFLESHERKEPYLPNHLPYLNSPNVVTSLPCLSGCLSTPLSHYSPSVSIVENLLRQSLQLRISKIPHHANTESTLPAANLAVLFSGGLDCTLLARLAHEMLDPQQPIDLINVAFENPRVHRRPANLTSDEPFSPYELCPDRITGRASFDELRQICTDRPWRFLAVNVPYKETLNHRSEVISLIYPHNTEMDLSIAFALYFASRGEGLLYSTDEAAVPYTTNARVLLSGLGADELFGGYTRHATAFNRNGLPGLLEELNLDVGRLGKRNLGRDDRVLSNWARETRFPFLDENLVRWAVNAPVRDRCGFDEDTNQIAVDPETADDGSTSLEPGKKVLRCLAWKLGMKGVAAEKKRAIQFGARTAKMEVGRTKGTQTIT